MNPKINNKRKTKGSSYFDPLINQYNGDIFKAPKKILISKMKKLVIDIIRGNVPYEKYGKYFTPEFIYHLTSYVESKYNAAMADNETYKEYVMNHPGSTFFQARANTRSILFNAWSIVYKNMQILYQTGDVQTMLICIPNQMKDYYKNTINLDD